MNKKADDQPATDQSSSSNKGTDGQYITVNSETFYDVQRASIAKYGQELTKSIAEHQELTDKRLKTLQLSQQDLSFLVAFIQQHRLISTPYISNDEDVVLTSLSTRLAEARDREDTN